jgi:hypothetical protein
MMKVIRERMKMEERVYFLTMTLGCGSCPIRKTGSCPHMHIEKHM